MDLKDFSLDSNVFEATSQMATMLPPAVKAWEESLSPLPPTPMQATLMRSFAPRTRPTNGKGSDAAPAARVVRRRNVRRSRRCLDGCLGGLFSINHSLFEFVVTECIVQRNGLGRGQGDNIQVRRMQQVCSSRIKQIIGVCLPKLRVTEAGAVRSERSPASTGPGGGFGQCLSGPPCAADRCEEP